MKRIKVIFSVLLVVVMLLLSNMPVYYSAADVDPFPIGIFWPPSPADTTNARYAEISQMNANFVVAGNGIGDFATNDQALACAAANGVKVIVEDSRLLWNVNTTAQTSTGGGYFVNSNNSLGQTFKTPVGVEWVLNTVQLYIDKTNWASGITLTLKVYAGTNKSGTLLGSASITGPVDTNLPVFTFNKAVTSSSTYYMELSSNSSTTNVGWVVASTTNTYVDGQAYQNGTALSTDLWFSIAFSERMYADGSQPANADIDAITQHYKNNSALLGYHIKDEPSADMMTRLEDTTQRFRQQDPGHMTFVNLFPTYADADQLGVNQFSGDWVRPNRRLGQTFKTSSDQTTISTVQMWVDNSQWGSNEPLTLSLWNSTAKTTLIAQKTISGPSYNWPQFTLNATVSANTQYYLELTHGGGGDNSVGWVVRSKDNDNWYNDGTGYVDGSAINSDFWFTINQNIQGGTYEDYVYRWARTKPDVLCYDHYPFLTNNGFKSDYYTNMEIIRRQSLSHKINFWTYIQSVGMAPTFRAPSQSDLRYHIYTSLAYGAKGYIYFTYWTPPYGSEGFNNGLILENGTQNTSYTWAKNINGEVLKLGPTLKALTSQAVYHTGSLPASTIGLPADFFWKPNDTNQPLIISYFKNNSGRKYVMVVNRDTANARNVTFTLSPKPTEVKEISKSTGAEVNTNYNSSTGTISSSLSAGEGRIYVLPSSF